MLKIVGVLLILLSGCIGFLDDGTEPVTDPGPFALEATGCKELLMQVAIDGEHAQDQLPDGYTALVANGQAFAIVGLKECATTLVDGTDIGPASTADIGILLETQNTTFVYYQTQWYTDSIALHDRLQEQGWNTALVDDQLVDNRVAELGAGSVSFVIPATEGLVRAEATVVAQEIAGDLHAIGWYESEYGPITVDKVLSNAITGAGQGTVTANGEVFDMLGASNLQGTATWGEYRMEGTVGPAA